MKFFKMKLGPLTVLSFLLFLACKVEEKKHNSTKEAVVEAQKEESPLIAFWSERDGNPEIYTMRLDGSNLKRLTTNEKAEDSYPVFSPDGSKIVFESNRTGNFEIYTMNADGSNQQRLTDTREDELSSSWSPDGSKIVFVSFRDNGAQEIYRMNADGSNQTRLTNNDFPDEAPHFSPDGNLIATESGKGKQRQIHVMNADGSNHKAITNMKSYQGYPTWSSDGSKIFFDSDKDGGGIYSINKDGTGLKKITEQGNGTFINQSPDGSKILFFGTKKGEKEGGLYTMDSEGKHWKKINKDNFQYIAATWNPVSFKKKNNSEKTQKIAFHSSRDGNSEIYSIHADGTNEKRLTNNDAYDGFPSWSPDGTKILFQSNREGENIFFIYVMNSDGTNVQKIPNTKNGNYAKWSRDGSKIAFFADKNNNTEIFLINTDGSNPTNITNNPTTDETPTFTADGSTITFQTNRGAKQPLGTKEGEKVRLNYGIYSMNADGSNLTQITDYKDNDENPSVSPDGKQVVFQSYINDGLAVVTVNTDGTNKKVLTDATPPSGSPAWSGDGKKIAYDSMKDGNFEIFTMNIDGSGKKQLTFTGKEVENSGACWTQY